MALSCGLTSVRGNRGENYENEPSFAKKIQRKNKNKKIKKNMSNRNWSLVKEISKRGPS
jgi:hypothetical protein